MSFIAVFLVASIIGAAMVAWVIVWATNRAASSAVTRHFKASEYILETGNPPPEWLAAPVWKRLLGNPFASARSLGALARLDEMIRFFEQCSFYEDEFAREQHLAQLEAIRRKWQTVKDR